METSADLDAAMSLHGRGLLRQASLAYQAILRSPDDLNALHLLGVASLQQGDAPRAIELIGRAIALNPTAAAMHANLAEAYRATGDCARAAGCCRTALRLEPHDADAANNLGLALQGLGQAEAALAQFQAAVRTRPDFAMAHNNLANVLRLGGNLADALAHFRRAVELDPQLAEAQSNLGQLLLEQLDLDGALLHCREAVRLRSDLPEAHNNLGNVLRELRRLADAKACYAEVLRLAPDQALGYSNMGQALQEEGRLDDAVTWYRRAVELDPTLARAHWNLGGALQEQGKHEEAIAECEMAVRLAASAAEAHNSLGWVRHEQGDFEGARACYGKAIELKPGFAAAHANLGIVREELSDFPGAQQCFREALRHNPRDAGALAQLAMLLHRKLPEADLAALQQRLADADLADSARAALQFALASVLDAQGDYAQAAGLLAEANAVSLAEWRKRGQGYDPAAHERVVAGIVAACTPAFFQRLAGTGLPTEQPVFIFGLPRSGTTLVEQILASHSQVFGAGELRLAQDDFQSLGGSEEAALEGLARLDGETARRMAGRHLERLQALAGPAPRITDKMPDNYLHLGLLAVLFPRAKWIHCRRDLRDVAVSCWITSFRHIRWASDFGHIAARFRQYERLMEHWRRVLPVPWLDVEYEETVADVEAVARRLLAWCGLEWEPGCLEFHRGKRPVRTASVTQVRQPIYTRSVARWKHYESALAPLWGRLEGP